YGIAVIDEATSGTEVAYGATLTAQKSTLIVGSTTASYTALSSPQSATASPVESSDVAIDGYGNLVFDTASENGAGSNDTIWVLPEAPGSAAGTTGVSFGPYQIASVTAGDIYLIAGQEGDESESTNGVLATSADFDDVDSLTVDSEGNIIAGDEGTAFAVSVIAENPNAAYDISSSSWTVGDVYTLSGGSGATSINPSGNASSYETPPVDSVGWADPPGTGGYLFVDGDNLPTLADEYQISLAPSPSAIITQTSPTTGNGTTSTPMPNTQLNFTGQGGTVSCAPGTEGDLTVTAGCVAEQTANATGIFTVTGNVTDSFGNTGSGTPEYTFSLDVGPSGGQVPESPIIVLLPVVALGAVGAVLFINRRRRVARTQS
ncbi:MAG TPA: hypothetical protein VEJ84_12260, partial [Acidimicrobiales bacterium]|nr:hypothetical protein [Acidimicrobiales bacterium]